MSYFTEIKIVDPITGDLVHITSNNQLKIYLESLDPSYSSNSESQLNVTPFHADGTEGNLLSGVKYVAGKRGIDAGSNALINVPLSMSNVHNGLGFNYRTSENMIASAVKDILIVTPDTTRWAHMVLGTEALESKVTAEIYEAVTTSADGSLLTARNKNRNISDNNTTLIYDNPTITATGSILAKVTLLAGSRREYFSRVLKQGTKYLMRITEIDGAATDINWDLNWCECINVN